MSAGTTSRLPRYTGEMICLDVGLNGKKVCRAGLGKHGLVHLNAAVHSLPPAWKNNRSRARQPYNDFTVGGVVYDRRPPGFENVSWPSGALKVGDELRLHVVESDSADAPIRRERSEPMSEAAQWDMICRQMEGVVRHLRGFKGKDAAQVTRELLALSKKARRAAAQFDSEDIHRALFRKRPQAKSLNDMTEGRRRSVRTRRARG